MSTVIDAVSAELAQVATSIGTAVTTLGTTGWAVSADLRDQAAALVAGSSRPEAAELIAHLSAVGGHIDAALADLQAAHDAAVALIRNM